jgi:carbonic anhydrase
MVDAIIDRLIEGNNKFQWKLMQEQELIETKGKVPKYPVLILTCMDSRIDVHRIFQLNPGDVFILRNGGNQYSEDVIRSLLIAIYEYDVQYIIILGHLDCGMKKVNLNELKNELPTELLRGLGKTSIDLRFAMQRFFNTISDEILNVKNQVDRLQAIKSIPNNVKIIGMIYDPATGWVFSEEDFMQFSSYEMFMRNYRVLLRKKQLKHIGFLETIENDIVSPERIEPTKINQGKVDKKLTKSMEQNEVLKEEEGTAYVEAKDILESKMEELNLPDLERVMEPALKIQTPKIHVPKIRVYIPTITKPKKYVKMKKEK